MSYSEPAIPATRNLEIGHLPVADTSSLAKTDVLLLLAVVISIGLDVLTNIFDPSPVVPPLKGLILILVLVCFRTLYSYCITLTFIAIFAIRELNITITNHDISVVGDSTFFFRILFFITWLLLFYEKRHHTRLLQYVLRASVATIVLSVLCQLGGMLFHWGFFAAYREQGRGGYKGLFLSENDTGVFYLISLIYAISLLRTRRWLYAAVAFTGLFLLGLGSKTALLGAIVVPILYFFFARGLRSPFILRRLAIRPRVAFWWIASLCLIGVVAYLSINYFTSILNFISYTQLLRIYQESGLLTSLLSFRDQKVLAYFASIRSSLDVLFGLQLQVKPEGFADAQTGYFMYEIDLFDYLARVGVLGLFLTASLIWRAAQLKNWRGLSPERKTLIVTIALLGCTVGHTLISSINGLWIAFWLIAFGSPLLSTDPHHQRSLG
ncbi:MAG TPA: hypothetical protein VGU46_11915 [Acidobacteriaceae bacterium]|nr:hypothetical protein [Acidobacteriaceae bacterium]